MYLWLDSALCESSQVITASRRLARVLRQEYAQQRVLAGDTVWQTPVIQSWSDWLSDLVASHGNQLSLPTVITSQQSQILWERCLRREISDPLLNVGALARQSRDAWNRLREWNVSIAECQRYARSKDQRLFAAAANNYQSILKRESWVDEAGLARLAIDLIGNKALPVPRRITLAGFDRVPPLLQSMLDAIVDAGGAPPVVQKLMPDPAARVSLVSPENSDAELRAAGAWARRELSRDAATRLAIVVTHLEQNAPRCLRLIKEGLIPDWQNASTEQNAVVNISYGKKLTEYPAISMALLAISWLHRDLSSRDISKILRASVFAAVTGDARVRIELKLRDMPEQTWSPGQFLKHFAAHADQDVSGDGMDIIRCLVAARDSLPLRQSPEKWVLLYSELLLEIGWPGTSPLSSADFQTVNRWRELLNEVARLALVTDTMTAAEALGRIATIASETIFQPEGGGALVNVMGPLEAAGLEFDCLWVTGMTSSNWPPPGRALALVSRELQRLKQMPDSTPVDTLQYATRVMSRLLASASSTVFSYPQTQSDAQQSASELLSEYRITADTANPDPGWRASQYVDVAAVERCVLDPVPAVLEGERIVGGANTIQQHLLEPFTAFVSGRLGVRGLWPMQAGLPPNIRGSLIHNALQRLYADCPGRDEIQQWDAAQIGQRTEAAVQGAFWRHEQHADSMLQQLLILEKTRVKQLLQGVIRVDCSREDFRIKAVEQELDSTIAGLAMRLRVDRVDIGNDQQQIILDYKTGTPKRLLDREQNPKDMQLVVYAFAVGGDVGGIGLFNIDSRSIALDAARRDLSPKLDWDSSLTRWKRLVEIAAAEIVAGDIRINARSNAQQVRPLALLSRYRELLHEQ